MERLFTLALLLAVSVLANAQIQESFEDGDFTSNPVWTSANVANWLIDNGRLRSNSTTTNSTFSLATASTSSTNAQWDFTLQLQFNPSGANHVDIYLISDKADLTSPTNNGYFVRIGGTPDEVSLFKHVGNTTSLLIDGRNGSVNKSNNTLKLKVTRDELNVWTLLRDTTGIGETYFTEGMVTDASINTSAYFGIKITQSTASFFNKHFIDDVYVGDIIQDTEPPVIQSVTVLSSTELELLFSEKVEETTAETTSNYSVNNSVGNPTEAVRQSDEKKVRLTFNNNFPNARTSILTVTNVADILGNAIIEKSEAFFFFEPVQAEARDILFSEVFADPNPSSGLPEAEYVELFNRSNKVFDLAGWKYKDANTTINLPAKLFYPDEYIVLVNSSSAAMFAMYPNIVSVSSFPTLSNGGELLVLEDNDGSLIDSVRYTDKWYRDDDKKAGGYSLERISQHNFCIDPAENWIASIALNGGTPGVQNSVFNNSPDIQGPLLEQIEILSSSELLLTFNEKLNNQLVPLSTFRVVPARELSAFYFTDSHLKTIHVSLAEPLVPSITYELTVAGLTDCTGNVNNGNDTPAAFVLAEQPVQHDVILTEIFADPSPVLGLPEAEFIELYNRSNKVFDLAGWKFKDANTVIDLPTQMFYPGEYIVLVNSSSAAMFSMYPNIVSVSSFPTLSNAGELLMLEDNDGLLIDSVRYTDKWYGDEDKKTGGYSLERINQHNFCIDPIDNWIASTASVGGTPGETNSVSNNTPDIQGPILEWVEVLSSTELVLTFNEKLNEQQPLAKTFQFIPKLEVSVLHFINAKSLHLVLAESLLPSISYELIVSGLRDCSENLNNMDDLPTKFVLAEEATHHDVIITEIFADPNPTVALPEAEFIELYNRSNKVIDLKNWVVTDGSTNGVISSYILHPDQYVVLCSRNEIELFNSIENVVPVINFPTLNNSGEPLMIKNLNNVLIDSVNYSLNWYKDLDKQQGGWTLERKDLNNFCLTDRNWEASNNESGGTMGKQNSLFTHALDTTGPTLTSITVTSPTTIILHFDEKLSDSALQPTQIEITPAIEIEQAYFLDKGYTTIGLTVRTPLTEGSVYSVLVNGLRDCTGNPITTPDNQQSFGLAAPAIFKDLIITEIMADPSPVVSLPEAEYIEVYNRSDKLLDLGGWELSDASGQATLNNYQLLPQEYVILCSSNVSIPFGFLGKTLAVTRFPSLSNAGEALVIKNSMGELIDSVNYSITWYGDAEKTEGGWSLELIDRNNICAEGSNWMASEDVRGGSPGITNSVDGSKPDLMGPRLLSVQAINEYECVLVFNEKLEKTLPMANDFLMTPPLPIASISFTNTSLREIRIVLSEPIQQAMIYTLQAMRVQDCAGNSIQEEHNSATLVLPQEVSEDDVLISEVLFNPWSGGVDFVEVYNKSNKHLNIRNWVLANWENEEVVNPKKINQNNHILYPHSFTVFTSNAAVVISHYPQSSAETFLETDLPPMNDDEGSIALIDSSGAILDFFVYQKEMHSALLKNEEGVSLERISLTETTKTSQNWKSGVAATGFATPGYKNANSIVPTSVDDEVKIEPEIFEPLVGQPNFTRIQYKFDNNGLVANAKILDAQGRLIKQLTNNEILAGEGFFTWDGDRDDGTKARIGYYTLWMEVFDASGFVKVFRKRIVVASRF